MVFRGFAYGLAGIVVAAGTGLAALVAASGPVDANACAASCRAQHNQCRIKSKGSPSCDAQLQACLQGCLKR